VIKKEGRDVVTTTTECREHIPGDVTLKPVGSPIAGQSNGAGICRTARSPRNAARPRSRN
jgi:hypothetical protein